MQFDIEKFSTASFEARTAAVDVPDQAGFFKNEKGKKKQKPVFMVRGLTGEELASVNEAVQRNQNLTQLIEGLVSGNGKDKAKAVQEAIGVAGEKVPDDLVKRFALLRMGCVDPVITQEVAVKLGKAFPTVLYELTNRILQLTGQGSIVAGE